MYIFYLFFLVKGTIFTAVIWLFKHLSQDSKNKEKKESSIFLKEYVPLQFNEKSVQLF